MARILLFSWSRRLRLSTTLQPVSSHRMLERKKGGSNATSDNGTTTSTENQFKLASFGLGVRVPADRPAVGFRNRLGRLWIQRPDRIAFPDWRNRRGDSLFNQDVLHSSSASA